MTFSSVIEFGIVSFLHRRIERTKRKKAQLNSLRSKVSSGLLKWVGKTKKNKNLKKPDEIQDLDKISILVDSQNNLKKNVKEQTDCTLRIRPEKQQPRQSQEPVLHKTKSEVHIESKKRFKIFRIKLFNRFLILI